MVRGLPSRWRSDGDADPARIELILTAAEMGSFDWDLTTGALLWDDQTCRTFGVDPAEFVPHVDTFYEAVLAEDLPGVRAAMQEAIDTCGDYAAEHRIRRPDGAVRWVDSRGRVLQGSDGKPARMVGVVRDSTEVQSARDTVARTLEHMADAFLAVDGAWLVTYVNRHAEELMGAEPGAVQGRPLFEVWPGLVTAGYERTFRAVVENGEPATLSVYVAYIDRWYQLRVVPGDSAGLSVFATDITATRAAELERQREPSRPELARRVLAYSAALAEAVTLPDVTDVVATMVLGAFDGTGMLVSLADSGRLRLAGHAGYDDRARRLFDGLPLDDNTPIAAVLRSRRPLFLPSPEAYLAMFPARRDLVEASGKRAWAFLPMVVSGRTLGTLTISFDQPRDLDPEERSLLVSVAGLLAQTLERARLRDAERRLAAEVQRDLLPRVLPQPAGLVARARYLPATDGMQVGGDWYDLLELPRGRVGVVIGDVQGHNVRAAVLMGQLRNALRAYATEGHEPADVMSRTNQLLADQDPDMFATCCYVAIDRWTGRADVVLAGHPPPLVRSRDGSARLLDAPAGLPLGVDPDEVYAEASIRLRAGDTLVLYTDGLVEDPRTPLEHGLDDLRAQLQQSPADDLDVLADALVGVPHVTGHRSDDIAVLVVRHDGADSDAEPRVAASTVDRADPRAARRARDFIAANLREWELAELCDTTVLLVSEVVTNALRHTEGPIGLELIRTSDRVRVEVSDETATPPTPIDAEPLDDAGRGITLMSALSDRWGTAPRGRGKVVWFELDQPDGTG